MPESDNPILLQIAGAYVKNDAYPNVAYRIAALAEHPYILTQEICCSLLAHAERPEELIRTSGNPVKFLICHLLVFARFLFQRRPKYVYTPYPAIFFQFLVSLLPGRLRPELTIIDAFISIYDTVVLDRRLIKERTWLAKLIFKIERRAFNSVETVLVDTGCNRDYYARLFNIPPDKFVPVSLATDEHSFRPAPYVIDNNKPCQILFIGTLIPLHGIQTIIAAIRQLNMHRDLNFHIIGDGQDAAYVHEFASGNPPRFHWSRDWYNSAKLNSAILDADICLGIFGSTPKTQRVCPYKIYHYSRVGRPVITARTEWTESITNNGIELPFLLVDCNQAEQLADAILSLAQSPAMRLSLADKSREFYRNQLAVTESTGIIYNLLRNKSI